MHDLKLSHLFDRYRTYNDLSALAQVFDAVSPELLKVARHVAGRGVDAEDVVQATFLAAIERAITFDVERPLVPWLMGILINQARLARRRHARWVEDDSTDERASTGEPLAASASASELGEAVTRALGELPETYRDVLVPHLAEGKKPHEIARDLGRPQGTVRAQIHRGIRLMRKLMPAGFAYSSGFALFSLREVRRTVLEAGARARDLPASSIPAAPSLLAAAWPWAAGAAAAACLCVWLLVRDGDVGPRTVLAADEPRAPRAEQSERVVRDVPVLAERTAVGELAIATATDDSAASVVEPFGALDVRVSRHDGTPARGVVLALLAWGDERWYEHVREAATDEEGRVRFERVPAGRVGLHLPSLELQQRADVFGGQNTPHEFKLPRGTDARGVVLDADGLAVAGAIVDAWLERSGAPLASSARTGADGRFEIQDLDPRCSVAARAPDSAPSALVWLGGQAGVVRELRLQVTPSQRRLHGTIVDASGAPIAGASLELGSGDPSEPRWGAHGELHAGRPSVRVLSDAQGVFEAAGLPHGPLWCEARAPGFAATRSFIAASAATDAQRLVLTRGSRLSGQLRYPNGLPAGGASLELSSGDGAVRRRVESSSDAAGRFELDGLAPGMWSVVARASGIGPELRHELTLSSGIDATWEAQLAHPATIRGAALSDDGRKLRTWLVRAVPVRPLGAPREELASADSAAVLQRFARSRLARDNRETMYQCWLDQEGHFVVPCAPGFEHRLEIRPRARWNGVVLGWADPVAAGASDVLIQTNPARAHAVGRVLGPRGEPLAGASVWALANQAGFEQQTTSDAGGRFSFDLPVDTYDFVLWPVGRSARVLGRVELGSGVQHEFGELNLPAVGTLRLRLEGLERLVGLDAELRRADGVACSIERDPPEHLVAPGLEPGSYQLTLKTRASPDQPGREFAQRIEIAAGESKLVTLR